MKTNLEVTFFVLQTSKRHHVTERNVIFIKE